MCFDIEEGVTDCKTIKVSRSDANDNVCKEELPIFTNNSPSESLIHLLGEILQLDWPWIAEWAYADIFVVTVRIQNQGQFWISHQKSRGLFLSKSQKMSL